MMEEKIRKEAEHALELMDTNFTLFYDYMAAMYKGSDADFIAIQQAMLAVRIEQLADGDQDKHKRLNSVLWRRQVEIDRSQDPYNTMVNLFYGDLDKFKSGLDENLPKLVSLVTGDDNEENV